MRLLASTRLRLFLVCWAFYSLFFATNVVREHYPAFTLIERGDWVCDRYAGFHADIFEHTDGHWYVGNNLLGSIPPALPLALFDPLLDRLESYSQSKLAENPEPPDATYDTPYPNRRDLFRRVREAGLDLRLGASTAITSALLMAPLSALLAVLMYQFLLTRAPARKRALWLAFLFAFATPVFYRTAHLNHNMFVMQAAFGAFLLLYAGPGESYAPSLRRRLWAGLLCGVTFALDYAGAFPAAVLWGYFVVARRSEVGWAKSLRESAALILAALPPLAFLLGTQWAMYGDPFTPGQFVMRPVNFTDAGLKGITLPNLQVFLKNLVMPGWGLYTFGPLLLLALIPQRRRDGELILPRRERYMALVLIGTFMLFCSMNRYSLMQFNSGFRYLLPIVPFAFLQASDFLARVSKRTLVVITIVCVAHSAVLSMTRTVSTTEKELLDQATELGVSELELDGYWQRMASETHVPLSWRRVLSGGPELPWLTVLAQTSPGKPWLKGPILPAGLMLLTSAALLALWRLGERLARTAAGP